MTLGSWSVVVLSSLTKEGNARLLLTLNPKPINISLYLCDNNCFTKVLYELLMDDEAIHFLVVDGKGTLYGAIQGSNREVLHSSLWTYQKAQSRWSEGHALSSSRS